MWLQLQQQRDEENGFSNPLNRASFTDAMSWFGTPETIGAESNARTVLAPDAYQQITGQDPGSFGGGGSDGGSGGGSNNWSSDPSLNPGGGSFNTGTASGQNLAPDAYQQITGSPTPSYDQWSDYGYSDSISSGGGIGHA